MKKNYQWNAEDYASHSSAQQKWARELIGKLKLKGNESVLDIGCGDGKVTAELSRFLENGSVVGIDSSKEMLALAVSTYDSLSFSNLSFQHMDAGELSFHEKFDIIFSNAVLHWVIDHRPVLAGAFRALRKGGKLLVQAGGKGNASEVISVFDTIISQDPWKRFFQDFAFPYGFYGPKEYEPWLLRAGFTIDYLKLIPKEMVHKNVDQFKGWVRTTWLPYLNRVPENKKEVLINQLAEDYRAISGQLNDEVVVTKMVRLEYLAWK